MNQYKKRKIVFVVGYFAAGGAERVISILANAFADKGYSVSLVYFKKKDDFYALDNSINKYYLDIPTNSKNFILGLQNTRIRILKLREQIKQIAPDAVISFITDINVLTILAARKTDIPVIISERTNPFKSIFSYKWKIAARFLYKYAAKLVLQTSAVKKYYKNINDQKIEIIPNPVKEIKSNSKKKENIIIGVGRLEYPKGFDMLIQAFVQTKAIKNWKLLIAGEGSERECLQRIINKNEVQDRVKLIGLQESMDEIYSNASIYVLSSRYEGYPNSLAEAMSAGLPCISFNCDFGPAEMIRDNDNGILVDAGNIDKLAEEIDRLAFDETMRKKIGEKAIEIRQNLDQAVVRKKWESIFDQLNP